ncbi:MAG: helix-turn-helix transcriptional regulator [Eubacterium coprostanoligenes]|uniref:helix-turn-helix domain-containing protein n=1 Tax=Eubacterium coprostanoligenes TaxID=290054 RepID=UPI00240A8679|nr:helix-turn-helix transcriptional regulator [Eubacterium coprostanoligenes]MDD6666213.1 helix-turn-helix transcriptional regulator [Eubacterium coprostanoligenes]
MKMKIDNEKLMIALANNGMMLKDLCKRAGLSENAFRAIRQGKSTPRPATLGRIAKALNVDVQDIIQEGE